MPRTGLGQLGTDPAHDRAEILLLQRSADAVAIESHAVDSHRRQVAGGLATQVLVLGALHHREERLVRAAVAQAVSRRCSTRQRSAQRCVLSTDCS